MTHRALGTWGPRGDKSGHVLQLFSTHCLMYTYRDLVEVGSFIIPILQMRKLRHREAEQLGQGLPVG